MARLTFMRPPKVERDGIVYLATAAWDDHGIKASVKAMNGQVIASDTVTLTSTKSRAAFVRQLDGIDADAARDALLTLAGVVEAALRDKSRVPKPATVRPDTDEPDDADDGIDAQRSGKPSQATLLVHLATDLTLFHDPAGEPYAVLPADGHRETWPLHAKAVRRFLTRRFYEGYEKAPGAQAMQNALAVLAARAQFDGEEQPVYIRLAGHQGKVYLDLCDADWRVAEIDAAGWRVIGADACPVHFRRTKGMLPLPMPTKGGTLDALRPYLNIGGDDQWVLLVAWLVAALQPQGPYWILAVTGEQGAAKSTLLRLVRALIDPNIAAIRSLPRDERDLVIAATNALTLCFDNASGIPTWLSDALCRIATGGGFATRTLYENDEETIFNAMRPIALNGIEDVVTRGDLADRALTLHLPAIAEGARRTEKDLWRSFEQARPAILGALLTVVAAALKNLPGVRLDKLPRMADAAIWVAAAESALGWEKGTFMKVYTENRTAASAIAIEDSPLAEVVLKFMGGKESWEGKASELLKLLDKDADESVRTAKGWPTRPNALSGALRRLAPNLRAARLVFTTDRDNRTRVLRLEWERESSSPSSPSSSTDAGSGEHDSNAHDDGDAQDRHPPPPSSPGDGSTGKGKTDGGDDRDDHDDEKAADSHRAESERSWIRDTWREEVAGGDEE